MPLSDIHHFLLDMDGTVYLGRDAIEGAADFIRYLQDTGRGFLFFTNNPTADARQYSEKLARMGIRVGPETILTSGEATARYLVSETAFRRAYVIGMPSFEAELRHAGIEVTGDAPSVVVLAFDKTLTYAKLEKACLLLRAGLPYIATNPDKVCPTEYGYIPDCGATAELIRAATGCWPKFIGKPNPEMARMGIEKLGATPQSAAMVGDRLYTDMQMAFDAGIASVLVLSGETRAADLECAERKPDFVFDSVRALHRALEAEDS